MTELFGVPIQYFALPEFCAGRAGAQVFKLILHLRPGARGGICQSCIQAGQRLANRSQGFLQTQGGLIESRLQVCGQSAPRQNLAQSFWSAK